MAIVSSFAFATVGLNSYMVQKIELRFVESRQVNLDFFYTDICKLCFGDEFYPIKQ